MLPPLYVSSSESQNECGVHTIYWEDIGASVLSHILFFTKKSIFCEILPTYLTGYTAMYERAEFRPFACPFALFPPRGNPENRGSRSARSPRRPNGPRAHRQWQHVRRRRILQRVQRERHTAHHRRRFFRRSAYTSRQRAPYRRLSLATCPSR